ncbi:hypothetical protein QR680_016056 [Steinernema hermaphroditum]|uniref:C-type lectin domain-containing protein n=1 Tax=Steinernema hermaphroditum TaxID=289476 RepID=A0AA39LLX5_9BILA|nr:hypothetical protein QR680_016056 [Steinernema hermaphroditum]
MKSFFVFPALVAVASAACPDGWALFPKTNSCYRHYFEKKNYEDAKAACVAEGAALVTITSVDENEFVQVISTMDEDQRWNGQPWIGAYTDAPDGLPTSSFQWKWVDGQPWGYTNWCPENPDHNWEKCVQFVVCVIEGAFTEAWRPGGTKSESINRALSLMIAVDSQPLSMVDRPGFRNFMKTVVPNYSIKVYHKNFISHTIVVLDFLQDVQTVLIQVQRNIHTRQKLPSLPSLGM